MNKSEKISLKKRASAAAKTRAIAVVIEELVAGGATRSDALAEQLNARGVRLRRGENQWTASYVNRFVRKYRSASGVDLLPLSVRERKPWSEHRFDVDRQEAVVKRAREGVITKADAYAREVGALIARLNAEGLGSAVDVAAELNRRGVSTRRGQGGWQRRNVLNVLKRYKELMGDHSQKSKRDNKRSELRLIDGQVKRVPTA